VTGSGTYYYGAQVTLTAVAATGYEFANWSGPLGSSTDNPFTFEMPAENVMYGAGAFAITYTITYNDVDQAELNPAEYTIETETFTLVNPAREGYEFMGWTGSNGTTPQMTVTIQKGTYGDLEYTANWKEEGTGSVLDNYTDVNPEAWYASYVEYVIENGLMTGSSSTTFNPDAIIDRASMVTILYRISGDNVTASPKEKAAWIAGSREKFEDVAPNAWYEEAIAWAYYKEVTNGTSPTTFNPDGLITREQFVVFLYKFSNYLGQGTEERADLTEYPDCQSVSSWAVDGVSWGVKVGLLTGKGQPDGTTLLAPQGEASRAEAATLICRFHQRQN